MRRALLPLVTLLLVLALSAPALAGGPIRVFIGETPLALDQAPFAENGRTLVPLRPLAEALGFQVAYDPATQGITLSAGQDTIQLWVNSNRVIVNGQEKSIDVPAKALGGRTFVPVRFVAENLGAQVVWDEGRQAVVVKPGAGSAKELVFRAMARSQQMPDQIATGGITYAMVMGGSGMNMTFEMSMDMAMHTYQGEMLITQELTMPPAMGMPPLKVQTAVKGGKMYMQDPESGQWLVLGSYTPGQIPDLRGTGLEGLANLVKLEEELLDGATFAVVGTELVDGVNTTRIDVDVPGERLASLVNEMLGSLNLPAGELPEFQFDVKGIHYRMWIEPQSGALRKQDVDLQMTMTIHDPQTAQPIQMQLQAPEPSTLTRFPSPSLGPTSPVPSTRKIGSGSSSFSPVAARRHRPPPSHSSQPGRPAGVGGNPCPRREPGEVSLIKYS